MKNIYVVIVTFLFASPLVISNFIYIKFASGFTYSLLYFLLSIFFITSCFTKKNFTKVSKTVSLVLVAMFLINIFTLLIHDRGEFITGANYNKFKSEKWQKADFYNANQREYMLKDLVQNILPNKSIEEIINLLGKPYAIISEGKTYYAHEENRDSIFRTIVRAEDKVTIKSYEFFDLDTYYQSEIKQEIMIYYITGPAFMDHSTLDIYFDKKGIFKEYKYAVGST